MIEDQTGPSIFTKRTLLPAIRGEKLWQVPETSGLRMFYPVVREELMSYRYPYSLLTGEQRSYSEFPKQMIVFTI